MSKLFVVLCFGLAACNYDVGECYVRGHGNEGAGGSIITPTGGVGGFGHVPLEPQNHTGFDGDPCSQTVECTVAWTAGSAACNNQGAAGSCTTLYQGEHASLDEAKDRCEKASGVGNGSGAQSCGSCRWATSTNGDPVEKCKKGCETINKACINDCPKGDKNCMYKCNLELSDCLEDCER
jgi:hypothetical protein